VGSYREVLENFFTGCIVSDAATARLVNDNQIKKARREFPEQFLALFRPRGWLDKAQGRPRRRYRLSAFVERRGEFDLGSVGAFVGFGAALNLAIAAPNDPQSFTIV
jgi:hypothetical protein